MFTDARVIEIGILSNEMPDDCLLVPNRKKRARNFKIESKQAERTTGKKGRICIQVLQQTRGNRFS